MLLSRHCFESVMRTTSILLIKMPPMWTFNMECSPIELIRSYSGIWDTKNSLYTKGAYKRPGHLHQNYFNPSRAGSSFAQ